MLKGYRTVLVNLALALVAVTDYFVASGSIIGALFDSPRQAALAVAGVNVLNILLRFVTTGPVGKE